MSRSKSNLILARIIFRKYCTLNHTFSMQKTTRKLKQRNLNAYLTGVSALARIAMCSTYPSTEGIARYNGVHRTPKLLDSVRHVLRPGHFAFRTEHALGPMDQTLPSFAPASRADAVTLPARSVANERCSRPPLRGVVQAARLSAWRLGDVAVLVVAGLSVGSATEAVQAAS